MPVLNLRGSWWFHTLACLTGLTVVGAVHAHTVNSCGTLLEMPVRQGSLTSREDVDVVQLDADYYWLGTGLTGGNVYRVLPHDSTQKPYLLKNYFREWEAEEDEQLLQILSDLLKDSSQFKVARVTRRLGRRLMMEDVRGQSLHEISVNHVLLGEERVRARVANQFDRALEEFSHTLKSRADVPIYRFAANDGFASGFSLKFNLIKDHRVHRFYLHSDQVILSPEGVMTIVDPR